MPYDPGWCCRGCGAPKLPGHLLCEGCSAPRGGSKSDPRIKVQTLTSGSHNREEKEMSKKETKKQKGYHKRVAEQVARAVLAVTRAEKLVRDVAPWKQEQLTAVASAGVAAMKGLVDAFEALPEGFAPSAPPRPGLSVGEKISVSPNRREFYANFMSPADMDGLEVMLVLGGRLQVKTKSGVLHVVPRGHTQRIQAVAK